MLEIAQGVHYIHSEGIVHGDLSGVSVDIIFFRFVLIPSCVRQTSSLILNYDAR